MPKTKWKTCPRCNGVGMILIDNTNRQEDWFPKIEQTYCPRCHGCREVSYTPRKKK